MSYFFNFMRIWALSLFSTLGPLPVPQLTLDAVDRHWVAVAITQPTWAGWSSLEAEARKDPLGSFTALGQRPWYGYQFSSWFQDGMEPATTYEFRFRAYQASSGRYSDWAYLTLTTLR